MKKTRSISIVALEYIHFSHAIHIHHDSEMLGIVLVVHTPTHTIAETDNTVRAILHNLHTTVHMHLY